MSGTPQPTDHPATDEPVVRTAHLDVDRATAWDLVASEAGLARWIGADVRIDPTAGGALCLVDDDGTVRRGRVTDVDEGRSLTFTWAAEADPEAATTVTIAVDGTDDGTAVTVVEGRAGGRPTARLDAGAAWDHRLLHLELGALVAAPTPRRPPAPRRRCGGAGLTMAAGGGPAPTSGDDDGAVGAVFAALADPTRRAVLRSVAEMGTATATDLGTAVGVSRQAVAKHLDLLAAAGLVGDERSGRERRWRVTSRPMADAARWLADTGAAWDARLARLTAVAGPLPDADSADTTTD